MITFGRSFIFKFPFPRARGTHLVSLDIVSLLSFLGTPYLLGRLGHIYYPVLQKN